MASASTRHRTRSPRSWRAASAAIRCSRRSRARPRRDFDGLYEAIALTGDLRAKRISAYLDVWSAKRMRRFSFHGVHLHARTDYVGYWCTEAAGVVAALALDD